MGERSGTANGMCRRRRQQLATACTKASIGFPRLWLRKSADGATHTRADDMHPGPCYVHCCTSRQSVGLSVLRDRTHLFAESVCVTFYASMVGVDVYRLASRARRHRSPVFRLQRPTGRKTFY